MDFKLAEKVNKLAKVLKDNKLAATMDEAVEIARGMIKEGKESIEELKEKESTPDADELIKEEPSFIEKTKDVFEKQEEIPHAAPTKKETVKEIEEEIQEIRDEIKKRKQEKFIVPEELKEKVEEVKKEEKMLKKEEEKQ